MHPKTPFTYYRLPHKGKLRQACLNNDQWLAEHVVVTKNFYAKRRDYEQLKPWEKFRWRAEMVAKSTRTAVLTGFAAAAIWGISTLNDRQYNKIELCLPSGRKPPSQQQWDKSVQYHYTYLGENEHGVLNGIRVVSLGRLLMDITLTHGELEGFAFLEAILNNERLVDAGYTKEYFYSYINKRKGQWGCKKVLKIIERALYGIESVHESKARWLILHEVKLKRHEVIAQARISTKNQSGWETTKKLDLLLFGWLGVEIDGETKYHNNPVQVLRKERERETAIQNLGYHMLRIKPKDITSQLIPAIQTILNQNPQRISPGKHTKRNLNEPIYG